MGNRQEEPSLCLVVWDLLVANLVHKQSVIHDAAEVLTKSTQLKNLRQR